jgi:hypothetical protein
MKSMTDREVAYAKAVANLVDLLFHDYGVAWEKISYLLAEAGLDEEEISFYDLSDLESKGE